MNFNLEASRADDRLGLTVSSEKAMAMRRLISWLEGDLYEPTISEDGELSTVWHCGIEIVGNLYKDTVTFFAGTDYGQLLIQTVNEHSVAPEVAEGNVSFPGKYVMLALGAGLPEALVVLGPISEGGVKVIKHPKVLDDLTRVLMTPTTCHGFTVKGFPVPRLIGTFDNLATFTGLMSIFTVKQALEEIANPQLKDASESFIKALFANQRISDELISRASVRHESLLFRARLAEGLLALNIA